MRLQKYYCDAKDEYVFITRNLISANATEDYNNQYTNGIIRCFGDDGFCWQLDCPIQKINDKKA